MKKYIFLITIIATILGVMLFTSAINLYKNQEKVLSNSGYILKAESPEYKHGQVEKYVFNANSTYKKKYDESVVLSNSNGTEVDTESNMFIHYIDESISSFTKGVILDFSDIDKDPIIYYNISEANVLKKVGNNYIINTVNGELKLQSFIYKISDNKYIFVSDNLDISFNDGSKKSCTGYLEIEYVDNEVIKLYNESVFYQTVASNLRLNIADNIAIDLEHKVVLKNGDKKMTLANMVIDSNSNIDIIDLDAYKDDNELAKEKADAEAKAKAEEEKRLEEERKKAEAEAKKEAKRKREEELAKQKAEQEQEQTKVEENTLVSNQDNVTIELNKGNDQIIDTEDTEAEEDDTEEKEEVIEETPVVNAPEFTIQNFDVDAVSMTSEIAVKDDDGLLSSEYTINIYQNSTGKAVYTNTENSGSYSFQVMNAELLPDTEYTLSVAAQYNVEDVAYTKNFIYKVFRTDKIGIDFGKNYFTNTTMDFYVKILQDSKIVSAEMQILNPNGEVIETRAIDKTIDNVTFSGLENNTEYTVKIVNIYYDKQIIENGFSLSQKHKTLKEKPNLGIPMYSIDKKNSQFILQLGDTTDVDNGISYYRYEIYDLRDTSEVPAPVLTIETEKNQVATVDVNDIVLYRDVEYYFKVIAEFYDNEKYVEYESSTSAVMIMDSAEFPTVVFEEEEITFEKIVGNLIITDNYNTIDLNSPITINYVDSLGNIGTFVANGSLTIPVNVNNLRSNETYRFSIYANLDLKDGNDPIEQCYIGGAVVTTGLPNNLVAKFKIDDDDVTNAFKVDLKIQNSPEITRTLEAQTLTGMTISIYPGQSATGVPRKTITVVDTKTAPYESSLMDEYYTNTKTITPSFFGLRNSDFNDKYYTIVVSQGYDYTDYANDLPIINNVVTISTNGYLPDLPDEPEKSILVEVVRNRDLTTPRDDLEPATIVGYNVQSTFNNYSGYACEVTYNVYDSENNLIETKTLDVSKNDIAIPSVRFDVLDGTYYTVDDSYSKQMVRGNTYYFTYTLKLDLNNDGAPDAAYPYENNGVVPVLKSQSMSISKQEPVIKIYPSTSAEQSIIYKYNILDPDNTLIYDKDVNANGEAEKIKFYAKINNNDVSKKDLIVEKNSMNFNTVEVDKLSLGAYKLSVYRCLNKLYGFKEDILIEQNFEGITNLSSLEYNVKQNINSLDIEFFSNTNNKLIDRISSVDIEFAADDGSEFVKLNDLTLTNGITTVSFNQIANLCGKETTVNAIAYFDNGRFGYDLQTEYYTFQKSYKTGEDILYYRLQNQLVNTSTSTNMLKYTMQREDNILTLKNVILNHNATWELTLTKNGFLHNYDVILPKELKMEVVNCSKNNKIMFTEIIPGISFEKNNSGDIYFYSTLKSTKFIPTLSSIEVAGLNNNSEVYFDIYSTDENGSNEQLVGTINRKVSEFGKEIEITGLAPKTYYFLTVYIYKNGSTEKSYLYDVDYSVEGKKYYFSTLADVGISGIKVTYVPEDYSNKNLKVEYSLSTALGFERIDYILYKYNQNIMEFEEIYNSEELESSTIIKRKMEKYINANPGSKIDFDENYKIKIIPIAINAENNEEIDVGSVEYEFSLKQLSKPYMVLGAYRYPASNYINFYTTIYDDDCIIKDGKFTVYIYDANGNDITPNSYKDVEYEIQDYRKYFKLSTTEVKKAYSFKIITYIDRKNNGQDFEMYTKTYNLKDISEAEVYMGNVSTSTNTEVTSLVDLVFFDSYNITNITRLRYSVYNSSGYSVSDVIDFVPKQVTVDEDTYYTITLPTNITTPGKYYIELQALVGKNIVDTKTVEYIILEN